MSWIWNVIVSFSDEEFWKDGEDEPHETCAPLENINAWIPHGKLVDLTKETYQEGVGAGMRANIYGGGFKRFDIEGFIAVVEAQEWKDRSSVQLFLKGEEDSRFTLITFDNGPKSEGNRMSDEQFGTADDYFKAFAALESEGLPEKHVALLQAHFKAPNHTATWAQLADAVGYANGAAVNLQYGTLAGRVAKLLGIVEPPQGFWLNVLAEWADERDEISGHTAFVLRQPVIEALMRLGIIPGQE